MSYKVGDKVRIKDFNWYNANKDEDGDVPDKDLGVLFLRENDWCLGKEFIISNVYECIGHYIGKHVYELCGIEGYDFTDYMIDCLVERQNKEITNKES